MKSSGMRYFFLSPLVVLAMVACAKRDSDFAKQNQTKPSEKSRPGVSVSPTPANGYKGDAAGVVKDQCENPIKMEAQKDEKVLSVEDFINKEKNTYILVSSEFYVSPSLSTASSQFELPKDFNKTASDNSKIVVVCHTVKASETAEAKKISEISYLPQEISTEDGAVNVIRQDSIEVDAKEGIKTTSTLYAKQYNLKPLLSEAEGKQTLIIQHANGDITIKLAVTSDDKSTFTSGTYTLKK